MKKLSLFSFTVTALLLLIGCQSGKTIRVDSSQVTEYRDLTIRDLDEMSSKMFPKLMQSALSQSNDAQPPKLAIGPMTAQISVEFPEALRINRLRNVITQSGLAQISASSFPLTRFLKLFTTTIFFVLLSPPAIRLTEASLLLS